jgi:hypothetical protein
MARLLTVLLIFAALAGCGYNWMQERRMQAEIDALKIQVNRKLVAERHIRSRLESEDKSPAAPEADDAQKVQDEIDGWNSLAEQHYLSAKKAMAKSDAPLAAKEYSAFMDDKKKALVLEEQEGMRSIDTLRKLAGIKETPGGALPLPTAPTN